MTVKIVCRLLDPQDTLLGWVVHQAVMRGDGCVRSDGPVTIYADRSGDIACVSLHWCDLNSETRIPCPVSKIVAGHTITVYPHDTPLIVVGTPPKRLPPTTVGAPVAIGIPVGQMGARG